MYSLLMVSLYDEKTEGKLEKFKKNNYIRFKIKYDEKTDGELEKFKKNNYIYKV